MFADILPILNPRVYDEFAFRHQLEQMGEDVFLTDENGNTLLHHATVAGNLDACKILMKELGLDCEQQNKAGKRPVDLAKSHALKQSLQEFGAINTKEEDVLPPKIECAAATTDDNSSDGDLPAPPAYAPMSHYQGILSRLSDANEEDEHFQLDDFQVQLIELITSEKAALPDFADLMSAARSFLENQEADLNLIDWIQLYRVLKQDERFSDLYELSSPLFRKTIIENFKPQLQCLTHIASDLLDAREISQREHGQILHIVEKLSQQPPDFQSAQLCYSALYLSLKSRVDEDASEGLFSDAFQFILSLLSLKHEPNLFATSTTSSLLVGDFEDVGSPERSLPQAHSRPFFNTERTQQTTPWPNIVAKEIGEHLILTCEPENNTCSIALRNLTQLDSDFLEQIEKHLAGYRDEPVPEVKTNQEGPVTLLVITDLKLAKSILGELCLLLEIEVPEFVHDCAKYTF